MIANKNMKNNKIIEGFLNSSKPQSQQIDKLLFLDSVNFKTKLKPENFQFELDNFINEDNQITTTIEEIEIESWKSKKSDQFKLF